MSAAPVDEKKLKEDLDALAREWKDIQDEFNKLRGVASDFLAKEIEIVWNFVPGVQLPDKVCNQYEEFIIRKNNEINEFVTKFGTPGYWTSEELRVYIDDENYKEFISNARDIFDKTRAAANIPMPPPKMDAVPQSINAAALGHAPMPPSSVSEQRLTVLKNMVPDIKNAFNNDPAIMDQIQKTIDHFNKEIATTGHSQILLDNINYTIKFWDENIEKQKLEVAANNQNMENEIDKLRDIKDVIDKLDPNKVKDKVEIYKDISKGGNTIDNMIIRWENRKTRVKSSADVQDFLRDIEPVIKDWEKNLITINAGLAPPPPAQPQIYYPPPPPPPVLTADDITNMGNKIKELQDIKTKIEKEANINDEKKKAYEVLKNAGADIDSEINNLNIERKGIIDTNVAKKFLANIQSRIDEWNENFKSVEAGMAPLPPLGVAPHGQPIATVSVGLGMAPPPPILDPNDETQMEAKIKELQDIKNEIENEIKNPVKRIKYGELVRDVAKGKVLDVTIHDFVTRKNTIVTTVSSADIPGFNKDIQVEITQWKNNLNEIKAARPAYLINMENEFNRLKEIKAKIDLEIAGIAGVVNKDKKAFYEGLVNGGKDIDKEIKDLELEMKTIQDPVGSTLIIKKITPRIVEWRDKHLKDILSIGKLAPPPPQGAKPFTAVVAKSVNDSIKEFNAKYLAEIQQNQDNLLGDAVKYNNLNDAFLAPGAIGTLGDKTINFPDPLPATLAEFVNNNSEDIVNQINNLKAAQEKIAKLEALQEDFKKMGDNDGEDMLKAIIAEQKLTMTTIGTKPLNEQKKFLDDFDVIALAITHNRDSKFKSLETKMSDQLAEWQQLEYDFFKQFNDPTNQIFKQEYEEYRKFKKLPDDKKAESFKNNVDFFDKNLKPPVTSANFKDLNSKFNLGKERLNSFLGFFVWRTQVQYDKLDDLRSDFVGTGNHKAEQWASGNLELYEQAVNKPVTNSSEQITVYKALTELVRIGETTKRDNFAYLAGKIQANAKDWGEMSDNFRRAQTENPGFNKAYQAFRKTPEFRNTFPNASPEDPEARDFFAGAHFYYGKQVYNNTMPLPMTQINSKNYLDLSDKLNEGRKGLATLNILMDANKAVMEKKKNADDAMKELNLEELALGIDESKKLAEGRAVLTGFRTGAAQRALVEKSYNKLQGLINSGDLSWDTQVEIGRQSSKFAERLRVYRKDYLEAQKKALAQKEGSASAFQERFNKLKDRATAHQQSGSTVAQSPEQMEAEIRAPQAMYGVFKKSDQEQGLKPKDTLESSVTTEESKRFCQKYKEELEKKIKEAPTSKDPTAFLYKGLRVTGNADNMQVFQEAKTPNTPANEILSRKFNGQKVSFTVTPPPADAACAILVEHNQKAGPFTLKLRSNGEPSKDEKSILKYLQTSWLSGITMKFEAEKGPPVVVKDMSEHPALKNSEVYKNMMEGVGKPDDPGYADQLKAAKKGFKDLVDHYNKGGTPYELGSDAIYKELKADDKDIFTGTPPSSP